MFPNSYFPAYYWGGSTNSYRFFTGGGSGGTPPPPVTTDVYLMYVGKGIVPYYSGLTYTTGRMGSTFIGEKSNTNY